MNPEIGRFVSTDPWEGTVFSPFSLNKYLYVDANPVNYIDPSGLQWTIGSLTSAQRIQGDLYKIEARQMVKGRIKKTMEIIVCGSTKYVGKRFEIHHIATDKHKTKYTKEFKNLFSEGGLNLNDWTNKIAVVGHRGRHKHAYHDLILNHLEGIVSSFRGMAEDYIAEKLQEGMFEIAESMCEKKGKFYNALF